MKQPNRLKIYDCNLDINKSAPNNGLVDIYDGYIDIYGVIRRRPALTERYSYTATRGIQGVYYWKEKSLIVYIINGYVYSANGINQNPTLVSGSPRISDGICTFATQSQWLFIASYGGGQGIIWNGSSTIEFIDTSDALAPTNISSVAVIDGYIIASEYGTNRFWYTVTPSSDLTVRPTFDQYASAISTPGYIRSIKVINREITILKTDGIEVWFNDGVSPFRRYDGGTIPMGCKASASVCVADGAIFFLNENGHIVNMVGRNYNIISSKIDSDLRKILSATDCKIFRIDVFIVVNFLNENKTFVYDLITKNWYKWGKFNTNTLVYDSFLGVCSDLIQDSSVWIVGGRTDENNEKIFQMKYGYGKDGESIIRFAIMTAFFDHDTFRNKISRKLSIKIVKDSDIPDFPTLPRAIRCDVYSYIFDSQGYTVYSISGLPTGISFDYGTQTISGSTTLSGIFPIVLNVLIKDAYMKINRDFIVDPDYDWSVT